MHSGDGEEASGDVYRPLPTPREQRTTSSSEPREGIVLPSKGGRWIPPSQLRRQEEERREEARREEEARRAEAERWDQQPAAGQPWGAPQDPYAAQQSQYGHPQAPQPPQHPQPDAQATQLLGPYDPGAGRPDGPYGDPYAGGYDQYGNPGGPPSGDADKTQMMPPYGQQPPAGQDADRTQLLAPYAGHTADLVPQGPDVRQPLPPEQQFGAPVPPLPQSQPPQHRRRPPHEQPAAAPQDQQPPMPPGAPFAIRPGTPADPPPAYDQPAPPAATQQLPRMDDDWQRAAQSAPPQGTGQQAPQGPQDDYDYLYRRDDQPAPPPRQHQAAGYGYQQQPQPPAPRRQGYDRPAGPRSQRSGPGRKKLSTPAMAGIGVAVLALIGIGVGAIMSSGSSSSGGSGTGASSSAGSAAGSGAAETQAKRLNAVLSASNSSRTSVIDAVASIKSCQNLSTSAASLRSAASERDALVTKLSNMAVDKLPDGTELVDQLTQAWNSSSAADKYYAAWADQAARPKGCHKGQAKITLEVQRGNLASGEATLAKQRAVQLWNPIASRYGLPQRQVTQM